jgi:HlyD family secretion protein
MNIARITGTMHKFRVPLIGTVVLAAVGLLTVAVWSMSQDFGDRGDEFLYFTVADADLPIVITERGNLEAQVETAIRCEVESLARDSSGNYGTQIIFIVPNGSAAKEGDLLVELDSASLRERLDEQILRQQKAISALTQANAKYDNQVLQNQTRQAESELKVELNELELEMYVDQENGSYKLAKDDIERDISEQNNLVVEKRAQVKLNEIEMAAIQQLYNLGYRGRNDVDQVRLKLLQAEDSLAAATNNMQSFQSRRNKLDKYEREMQIKTLEGALETSKRSLQQVIKNNESDLAQVEAARLEAQSIAKKEEERLQNYTTQLVKCKIFAPHGGMVVYAREGRDGSTEIAEGIVVRERQRILTLPDLSRMQVKTQIHEAVLDQVRAGLPATIRVDAFPDQLYYGIVHEVAVVPASSGWYSSGVKTYDCVVRIDGEVSGLKPGMTAVVEIHVDRLKGVLTVPVQAVVQRNRDNWVYVQTSRGVEKRLLKLGRSNDKFVQIQEGLANGERVVLNPMAILEKTDGQEKDISPETGAPEMPAAVAESLKKQHAETLAQVRKPRTEEGAAPQNPDGAPQVAADGADVSVRKGPKRDPREVRAARDRLAKLLAAPQTTPPVVPRSRQAAVDPSAGKRHLPG